MDIQENQNADQMTLVVSGEVDLDQSPQLRNKITSHLNENKSVAVDLSGVSYIDSSGVSCLLEGMQLSKKKGVVFELINVSGAVMKVLELAHLDKILIIRT